MELTLILLSQEAYHERTLKWEVLSQAHGYTTAFARKHQRSNIPDIFDHLCVHVQEPVKSNILFVDHYDIEEHFLSPKQHYQLFLQLSQWFQFLKQYLPPACAIDPSVFEFIQKSSFYFQEETQASAVLLKLLYRFAQLEGLPVREQWLKDHQESQKLDVILHQPLTTFRAEYAPWLEAIVPSLHQWILQYSDHAQALSSSIP
ncbi:MAG: hypothetical protein LBD40_03940 [Puniceicoccales bacterium]|nr:hypothetical protein [Puniceicoccales bacterium]